MRAQVDTARYRKRASCVSEVQESVLEPTQTGPKEVALVPFELEDVTRFIG